MLVIQFEKTHEKLERKEKINRKKLKTLKKNIFKKSSV